MSDIGTKANVTNGVWVFQAKIADYNYSEKFQEGKIENWRNPTKKNKASGQIILFRQTQAPPEKMGIYGIGELLDTNYEGKGPTMGVGVRYLKRFRNFVTISTLRESAKKVGINKNKHPRLYRFVYQSILGTDIQFVGEDYELLQKILPELKEFLDEQKVTGNYVENLFRKWVEQQGGQILGAKDSFTGKTVGWPDFAVRIGEKIIVYEIKSENDKVTESQREMLRMLRKLGADVKILFYVDGKWDDRTGIWLD
jgi:hypothetical protein